MATTIPYDPNVVLYSLVNVTALYQVKLVADAQTTVNTAQDILNALIASRHSLDTTKFELENPAINTKTIDDKEMYLNKLIDNARANFIAAILEADLKTREARERLKGVDSQAGIFNCL